LFIELLAELTFDTLEKMMGGGVKIMVQITNEAPVEIKTGELRDLDRWCAGTMSVPFQCLLQKNKSRM
jgi:hypothetical protein